RVARRTDVVAARATAVRSSRIIRRMSTARMWTSTGGVMFLPPKRSPRQRCQPCRTFTRLSLRHWRIAPCAHCANGVYSCREDRSHQAVQERPEADRRIGRGHLGARNRDCLRSDRRRRPPRSWRSTEDPVRDRNKGKRGGGRAIYFLMIADDVAIMLFAYAKSEQEDLTRDQRKTALAILKELTDG